jgi:hypothetical protein
MRETQSRASAGPDKLLCGTPILVGTAVYAVSLGGSGIDHAEMGVGDMRAGPVCAVPGAATTNLLIFIRMLRPQPADAEPIAAG